jgi:hypothetical protein
MELWSQWGRRLNSEESELSPLVSGYMNSPGGELREYEYGLAELRFMDEITSTDIIFGAENIEPILGVIALEGAGFIVDPKNQTLRKLKARPLKRVA